MSKPRLLDLFCGAGGASMGYYWAGFEVVGVDIAPQKHYPFEFHQADAMTYPLEGFDVVHASPPCQAYSQLQAVNRSKGRVSTQLQLIADMRERLRMSSALWIIENVKGAASEMDNPLQLCGTSFGLAVWRHRLFESNTWLFSAGPCQHRTGDVSVLCTHSSYIGIFNDAVYISKGRKRKRPVSCRIADARAAMGIDWLMNQHELGESIPPAYTEWIGHQLLTALDYAKAG